MMKVFFGIGAMAVLLICTSCGRDKTKPFIEYAPQMYHSIPLEPYKQISYNSFFKDKKNMQDPVTGTVARGKKDYYYPYPATMEGYEQAGKELQNPLPYNDQILAEGQKVYSIYCQHCHGKTGAGDGPVAAKISQPPAYNSPRVKALTDGKMYHSITFGYNAYPAKGMGPHGSQLSPTQRWQLVHYVKKLGGFGPEKATADSTAAKKDDKVADTATKTTATADDKSKKK